MREVDLGRSLEMLAVILELHAQDVMKRKAQGEVVEEQSYDDLQKLQRAFELLEQHDVPLMADSEALRDWTIDLLEG